MRGFRILEYFIENAGKIVTRDELWSSIWREAPIKIRSIDQEIQRLRKAMSPKRRACTICTVRHHGYVLDINVKSGAVGAANFTAC